MESNGKRILFRDVRKKEICVYFFGMEGVFVFR